MYECWKPWFRCVVICEHPLSRCHFPTLQGLDVGVGRAAWSGGVGLRLRGRWTRTLDTEVCPFHFVFPFTCTIPTFPFYCTQITEEVYHVRPPLTYCSCRCME
jgi:hypothetical protein